MLQPRGVVVILQHVHAVGKAERRGDLDLVLRLVRAVAALALGLDEVRLRERVFSGELLHIVADAVGIEKFLGAEFAVFLDAQHKGDALIDDRLPVQHILKVFHGHVDVRKDVEIRLPADGRAGLFSVGRFGDEVSHDLAALKVQAVFFAVAADRDVHVLRGILRGAGAEAV